MKTKLLITLLAIYGIANAQNTWTQKNPFGGVARLGAVGFSIGTKGYIGTGYVNPGNSVLNDFWEWNPATNVWTQKANFGGGSRGWAMGASIGAKGYIGLGYDLSAETGDFWEYDTTANIWTQKTLFGGAPTSQGVCFSIGSKVYLLGRSYEFWEYNPITNSWTQKSNYPGNGIYSQVGFSIGNKGYVGTGSSSSNFYKDFWEYNPATDAWSPKADFGGAARAAAVGFSIGNKGYIGTGSAGQGGGSNLFKDFWEYNPSSDTWTQKAQFGGTARSVATGFSIGTKGYIGLGWTASGNRNDFWEYNPDSSSSGISEITFKNALSVYPNPFSSETTIQADILFSDATLTIYNLFGKQVKQLNNISGQSITLQRDKLPCGIYFINIVQDKFIFSNYKLSITDN